MMDWLIKWLETNTGVVDIFHTIGMLLGVGGGSTALWKGFDMSKHLETKIAGLQDMYKALFEQVEKRLDRMDNRMDNVLGYEKPVDKHGSQDKDDSDESLHQEG